MALAALFFFSTSDSSERFAFWVFGANRASEPPGVGILGPLVFGSAWTQGECIILEVHVSDSLSSFESNRVTAPGIKVYDS